MNRFTTLFFTSLLAASVNACSSDSNTDAGTTDAGVTDTGGGGGDTGPCTATPIADPDPNTSCSAPAAGDGGVVPYYQCASTAICPRGRFTNSLTQPGFRLTYIKITAPAALASAAILNTINPTLQTGTFLWGLQMDLTANTFRTGGLNAATLTRGTTGVGLMDGQFSFFHDNGPVMNGSSPSQYNPVSGTITVTGDRASTAMVTNTVRIPIFSDPAGTMLLTTLPLDNAVIRNVALTANRGCVGGGIPTGGRYTETTSRWLTEDECNVPYGTVEADITVDNAKLTTVTIGGSPIALCNIISGATCATDPQATWPRQPDSMVNGAPAYHLSANFAGIAANIAQ